MTRGLLAFFAPKFRSTVDMDGGHTCRSQRTTFISEKRKTAEIPMPTIGWIHLKELPSYD